MRLNRGHDYAGQASIFKQDGKFRPLTRAIEKKLKRRSAIEPTIGHVKSDNKMDRNYLKGVASDMMNAILGLPGIICGSCYPHIYMRCWKWAWFCKICCEKWQNI